MDLNALARIIQRELNSKFRQYLQDNHGDIVWDLSWDLEITANDGKDAGYDAMANSVQPEWVESHQRRNKNGGVTTVKGYWKQPKPLTAMNLAVIEVNEETNTNIGVNIEAEFKAFIQGFESGQMQLGNIKFNA